MLQATLAEWQICFRDCYYCQVFVLGIWSIWIDPIVIRNSDRFKWGVSYSTTSKELLSTTSQPSTQEVCVAKCTQICLSFSVRIGISSCLKVQSAIFDQFSVLKAGLLVYYLCLDQWLPTALLKMGLGFRICPPSVIGILLEEKMKLCHLWQWVMWGQMLSHLLLRWAHPIAHVTSLCPCCTLLSTTGS